MIPYGRHYIDNSDIKAVLQSLRSDWLTQGPLVPMFEKKLARYCGARYAVAAASGTAALHLAYLAAGLTSGDEVITTPNTFAATANMLLAAGVRPVFSDIRLDTYNLDERQIDTLVTKKTKAIVPVHFAGQPCDMAAIKTLATKRKLFVIEDACHALGATYRGFRIGSCVYSDMAVFSFHAIKSITTGEGGAILTNSKKFYDKLTLLRSHGITKDKNGFNVMTELGYNYRLTEFAAALGIAQLKKLNGFIKARRRVVAMYARELKDLKNITLPVVLSGGNSSWHLYVILVKNKKDRLPLYTYLRDNGVGVNFHYPSVYAHSYYRHHGYQGVSLPNAELYQHTCITLPCHVSLTQAEVRYIVKTIADYYKKYAR